MSDQKISQLPDSGAPQDTDQIPIARAGTTLSLLISNLKAAIPGGVSSVFTRTGAVTAQAGDYTAAQVGALPSTDSISDIAAANATGADWSNNSKKITSLANGSGAQDAAAFGQIPTALPPNGTASGDLAGSYPSPTVAAIHETSGPTKLTAGTITDGQFLKRVGSTLVSAAGNAGTVTSVTATDTSIVVAGTGAAPTIATGTLDVTAAADWSNNSHKITSLANGSGAQDALAVGQVLAANVIPVGDLVAGTAGQVLGGTGPSYALPPGYEYSYNQITANVNITGTTEGAATTIITCSTVTFDGTPVVLSVYSPQIAFSTTSSSFVVINVWEGASHLGDLATARSVSTTQQSFGFFAQFRFTPSAASHTYVIKAYATSTTGTPSFGAGTGGAGANLPAFARIQKV